MRHHTEGMTRTEINNWLWDIYAVDVWGRFPNIMHFYGYPGVLACIEADRIWGYDGKRNGSDVDFLKLYH